MYRFVAFVVILWTVLYSMYFHAPPWYSGPPSPPYVSDVTVWNWSGYDILTTSAVALTMHYNFPDVVAALGKRDVGTIRSISTAAFAVVGHYRNALGTSLTVHPQVTCLYMTVGVTCSLFFGRHTEELVTLNFKRYTGPSFDGPSSQPYAVVLRTLVVAFPVLDMVRRSFPVG